MLELDAMTQRLAGLARTMECTRHGHLTSRVLVAAGVIVAACIALLSCLVNELDKSLGEARGVLQKTEVTATAFQSLGFPSESLPERVFRPTCLSTAAD